MRAVRFGTDRAAGANYAGGIPAYPYRFMYLRVCSFGMHPATKLMGNGLTKYQSLPGR